MHSMECPNSLQLRCQPSDCQPTATGIYAGVTISQVEAGSCIAHDPPLFVASYLWRPDYH